MVFVFSIVKFIKDFITCLLGFDTVTDGLTCWFSKHFWDIHDYKKIKGGNGKIFHGYTYTCWKCRKYFRMKTKVK